MLAYLHEHGLTVLEQVLAQHPQIAALHPSSVNTLRILTDVVGEDVLIAYITLKIGTGGGCCDNAGRGGIMCRVDRRTVGSSPLRRTIILTSMTSIRIRTSASSAISCR